MRTISNKEAREMGDTRQIMAGALRHYRLISQSTPLFFTYAHSNCRYRSFGFSITAPLGFCTFYTAEYDTKKDTLYVDTYSNNGESIKIMIFE